MLKKIDAVEVWFVRRQLKVPWSETKNSEVMLRTTKSKRESLPKLKQNNHDLLAILRERKS